MFNLAVCAEMVFLDLPFEERVRRIAEGGFQVEIWNWTRHDIDALVGTGAEFSSMVGHTAGSLLDEDGAKALIRGAEESLAVAERLGCRRLLVFGTELGPDGVPLRPVHQVTGAMWLNAYKTLSALPSWASARASRSAWRISTPHSTTPAPRSPEPTTRSRSSTRWPDQGCG